MRLRTGWLALLVTAGMALPRGVQGQDAMPPHAEWQSPPNGTRPQQNGAAQVAVENLSQNQSNPTGDEAPLTPSILRPPIDFTGAGGTLAPVPATVFRGQDYAPPDPVWPLPLGHDRMEATGGLYLAGEFLYFVQTNPLDHQLIAVRGFFDSTGQLSGHQG